MTKFTTQFVQLLIKQDKALVSSSRGQSNKYEMKGDDERLHQHKSSTVRRVRSN